MPEEMESNTGAVLRLKRADSSSLVTRKPRDPNLMTCRAENELFKSIRCLNRFFKQQSQYLFITGNIITHLFVNLNSLFKYISLSHFYIGKLQSKWVVFVKHIHTRIQKVMFRKMVNSPNYEDPRLDFNFCERSGVS